MLVTAWQGGKRQNAKGRPAAGQVSAAGGVSWRYDLSKMRSRVPAGIYVLRRLPCIFGVRAPARGQRGYGLGVRRGAG